MTEKRLKEMRDTAPFKPFDIHVSNGHTLRVLTADHLFFIPDSSEFVVALPEGAVRFVDVEHVVSVGRTASRAKGR